RPPRCPLIVTARWPVTCGSIRVLSGLIPRTITHTRRPLGSQPAPRVPVLPLPVDRAPPHGLCRGQSSAIGPLSPPSGLHRRDIIRAKAAAQRSARGFGRGACTLATVGAARLERHSPALPALDRGPVLDHHQHGGDDRRTGLHVCRAVQSTPRRIPCVFG